MFRGQGDRLGEVIYSFFQNWAHFLGVAPSEPQPSGHSPLLPFRHPIQSVGRQTPLAGVQAPRDPRQHRIFRQRVDRRELRQADPLPVHLEAGHRPPWPLPPDLERRGHFRSPQRMISSVPTHLALRADPAEGR